MPYFSDDEDRIEFFFEKPDRPPSDHARAGAHSVLYLLRRELLETLGYGPNTHTESDAMREGAQHRLFASTILMFTTLDLLAKFKFGDAGGVRNRFRSFLVSPNGGGMPAADADLLWAIRNSLVHSFGVAVDQRLARLGLNVVALGRRKDTDAQGWKPQVITEHQGLIAMAYVDGILSMVLDSISSYRETLYGADSVEARKRFLEMFSKYGLLQMR